MMTMRNEKMEIFKNNLERQGFSQEFIKKSLEYFNELEEERELQEINTIIDVIDYYSKSGNFTCNSLQSELNLKDFRKDIYKLHACDLNNILNPLDYFENIEEFEIEILYTLYLEFFPREEEEEEEENL